MSTNATTASTEATRQALHAAWARAHSTGDRAEMARLEALARDLDAVRRRLALGALEAAADRVAAIRIGADLQPRRAPAESPAKSTAKSTVQAPVQSRPPAKAPRVEKTAPSDEKPGTGGGTTPPEAKPETPERPPEGPAEPAPSADVLAWGAVARRKHGAEFNAKVIEIARRLDCDPNYLMAVMAFETAETFSPAIRNAAGSGATGLIQFMPSTARRLGTTTSELAKMTALRQLDFVETYFRTATRRRLRTLSDIYMAVLWPAAVGKAESHVLFRKPSRAYTQNRGFDTNRDGVITKAEATTKLQQRLAKGMKAGRIG